MTERRLRYSERKRLAERGTLAEFLFDGVPLPLRWPYSTRLSAALMWVPPASGTTTRPSRQRVTGSAGPPGSTSRGCPQVRDARAVPRRSRNRRRRGDQDLHRCRRRATSEICEAVLGCRDVPQRSLRSPSLRLRLANGEARKVGSPALDEVVVGPALLAVRRDGWEEVERSFREALHHQRGGAEERDDALTSATAALGRPTQHRLDAPRRRQRRAAGVPRQLTRHHSPARTV
jgi:hypothetical protein